MIKLFLDSDIILDFLLQRPGFFIPALNLVELMAENRVTASTSSLAFVNVHYFLRKSDKLDKVKSLKRFRSIVSIIEVGDKIIDLALQSDFHDFEDAVQFYAAKSVKADFIITRNIKDYKRSTIPVLTAEQFLNTL